MNRVFVPFDLPPAPVSAASAQVRTFNGLTMGTSWSVKMLMPQHAMPQVIQNGIQTVLDSVVAQMSTWDVNSNLSRFNAAAASSWHTLPEDFFGVLAYALRVAEESSGAYDPTVGPLVNLWGFGPDPRQSAPPEQVEIEMRQRHCGWRRLKLNAHERSAYQIGGVYVDLSAIAKGFAVDQVASYLKSIGCDAYLAEVGGELSGFGLKPNGDPWWVALERPPSTRTMANETANVVALHGLAVATSGDYRRCFQAGGKIYSHTIDPRTGYPIAHNLASVTVVHQRCMVADAWSTAFNVLGSAAGLAYARDHKIAALFIDRNGDSLKEHLSPAFAAMLE